MTIYRGGDTTAVCYQPKQCRFVCQDGRVFKVCADPLYCTQVVQMFDPRIVAGRSYDSQ